MPTTASNTAAMIRMLPRERKTRIPRQVWPKHIHADYTRQLQRLVDIVENLVAPMLVEIVQIFPTRADATEGSRIGVLFAQLRARIARHPAFALARLETIARQIAGEISQWNALQLSRQIRAALGVNPFISDNGLSKVIDGFAAENVALIKDIPAKLVGDLELATTRALASGTLQRDLAIELESKFGLAKKRARFISRDQVGKLYGQVNKTRQVNMGITHFVWRSVNDERVRATHRSRNGNRYSYAEPPAGEIPGGPVLCRCTPEPDFSTILDLT